MKHTADTVILAEGHVLLIQRRWDPYAGRWVLPGGHVDAGENALSAAARELAEETGIALSPARLRQVGVYAAPGRDPRGRYSTTAYTATLPAPIQPTPADDAADARWWPLTALPEMAFDHADILRDALGRPAA
ncbi:NUDIX domain-containing protein [Streptomyces sp. SBT349]|uniref:NUDIX domain-containing protein n=1 Tax=Streptomyces sp. SBT349 TaxID=1580539 RepID=UPI00066AC6D2|nr:NUDIX hydrolase [Streptomyces sp. SBT349]